MVSKNGEARECANTNRASMSVISGKTNMNIVAKTEFNFHGVKLMPVELVPGIWLTSADVAKALGYKSTKSISNLFAQYEDEFSQGMTMVIESVTNGINGSSRRMKVRVFSLRGAHLIAMFARTPVAKEFRRWVLDILDREVTDSPIKQRFTDAEIVKLCYLQRWMERSQAVCAKLLPGMRAMESKMTGKVHDLALESGYTVRSCREILQRESKNLDRDDSDVAAALSMLELFHNEKVEIH